MTDSFFLAFVCFVLFVAYLRVLRGYDSANASAMLAGFGHVNQKIMMSENG